MVNATLREITAPGTGKCQTRRVVTPHTTTMDGGPWCNYVAPEAFRLEEAWRDDSFMPSSPILKMPWDRLGDEVVSRLRPRIEIGDLLWIKETWRVGAWHYNNADIAVDYLADNSARKEWLHVEDSDMLLRLIDQSRDDACAANMLSDHSYWEHRWAPGNSPCRQRPSIHMPMWASRITLEVTGVRFERVQEINEGDAEREGVEERFGPVDIRSTPAGNPVEVDGYTYGVSGVADDDAWHECPVSAFEHLWDSINEARGYGWKANPWVIVIEFTPHLRNASEWKDAA